MRKQNSLQQEDAHRKPTQSPVMGVYEKQEAGCSGEGVARTRSNGVRGAHQKEALTRGSFSSKHFGHLRGHNWSTTRDLAAVPSQVARSEKYPTVQPGRITR